MVTGVRDIEDIVARMLVDRDSPEWRESLKLSKRANLIRKNSLRLEKQMNEAEQKLIDSYIKMAEEYDKARKKLVYSQLKDIFAKEANYGLEAEPTKKGRGGRGLGGALELGALAVGTFLLVAAIHKAIANSKIIQVTSKAINQALGLLVDVILLPYVPIIAYGLIQLFQAIMTFKKLWDDINEKGIIGVLFDFLSITVPEWMSGWWASFMDFLFNPTAEKAAKALQFTLDLIGLVMAPALFWLRPFIDLLLKFLFGQETPTLSELGVKLWIGISDAINNLLNNTWIQALIDWIFGAGEKALGIPDLVVKIIPDFSNWKWPEPPQFNISNTVSTVSGFLGSIVNTEFYDQLYQWIT